VFTHSCTHLPICSTDLNIHSSFLEFIQFYTLKINDSTNTQDFFKNIYTELKINVLFIYEIYQKQQQL